MRSFDNARSELETFDEIALFLEDVARRKVPYEEGAILGRCHIRKAPYLEGSL